MKEFKHTPGPWLIKGDEVGYISNHDDQSFGMFCPVAIVTSQDNAYLIAAAPELLDALWVCMEHNKIHFGEAHNTVIQARAAIAKALGESERSK